MAEVKDWADRRVSDAIRRVCNRQRNSDLRADNCAVRKELAEEMRQLVRDCAFIVTETDIEWGHRVYHREEDASATLGSAAKRLKDAFPGKGEDSTSTVRGHSRNNPFGGVEV